MKKYGISELPNKVKAFIIHHAYKAATRKDGTVSSMMFEWITFAYDIDTWIVEAEYIIKMPYKIKLELLVWKKIEESKLNA